MKEILKCTKQQNMLRIALCAALILVLLCLLAGTAQAACAFDEATVLSDGTVMYLRPTDASPEVVVLREGTRIGVFCEEADGFCRAVYGSYRGYVKKEALFLQTADTLYGNVLQDTALTLNPGEFSKQVGSVYAGNGVTIRSVLKNAYEVVKDDGTSGFVPKSAIQITEQKPSSTQLKKEMSGVEVEKMQEELYRRGFLEASATGYYGDKTIAAVTAFQEAAGLAADGIAGEQTLLALYDQNNTIQTRASRLGIEGGVHLVSWEEAQNIFARGTEATITDVQTGIQWHEHRFGGWYHADCEPLTAEDTAKMKEAVGGSWSWDRRAIWVTVDGYTMAASMNGMPHMVSPSDSNNFPGHHCIHFLGSKVHQTSAECPRHQAMVQYAYEAAKYA